MTDWLKEAQEISDWMVEVRRDFHRWPEIGKQEYRTSEKIKAYLKDDGIETKPAAGTGVCGLLKGNGSHCVALRSDMDALPIEEETGLSYASENKGVMHACGHDMHMASLLGAARLLSKHQSELKGYVKFLFEPNEEQSEGGSRRMIHDGVLENPHVDAVFGAHDNPDLPVGMIGICYGPFFAAASWFEVHVYGNGTHGAEPEKGTDALEAACAMILKLDKLRGESDGIRYVTTVGAFEGGSAENVIPSTVSFKGIQRTFTAEKRKLLQNRLERIVQQTAEEYHVRAEVIEHDDFNGVVNPEKETAFLEKTAIETLGKDHVVRMKKPYLTTEDFGFFLDERGGCFWNFGIGGDEPLHSPKIRPDERALPYACALHCAAAEAYLKEMDKHHE